MNLLGDDAVPLASLVVATCALFLSAYSAWSIRARDARAQIVDLEARFSSIFADLPAEVLSLPPEEYTPAQRNAAFRYWSFSHAEWMATRKAHNRELQHKWRTYYSLVQASGFCHPGLQEALKTRLEMDTRLRLAWSEYLADLVHALNQDEIPAWLASDAQPGGR